MKLLLFFMSGAFMWTLLEYLIHRFLGHQKKGTTPVRREHQQHHAKAHYFSPIYKKVLLAVLFLGASTLITSFIFSFTQGLVFSTGLAGMYFLYEITHRRFHIKDPLIRYGLRMRKHHFYHHFGNPKLNHGVTTAIWDRVFGTFFKADSVKVPSKMAMKWLVNQEAEVKPRYQRHFRVTGSRS